MFDIFHMFVVDFLNTVILQDRGPQTFMAISHTSKHTRNLMKDLYILHCFPEHVEDLILVLQLMCFAVSYMCRQCQQNPHYMEHQTQINLLSMFT